MREEEISREAELQKKIAMIRLRGPADLSDLQLIFTLQNGGMQLRNKPLWKLDETDDSPADQYQRGLFNPARFFTNSMTNAPGVTGLGIIDGSGFVPSGAAGPTSFGTPVANASGFGGLLAGSLSM